jgi:hypothetical protein
MATLSLRRKDARPWILPHCLTSKQLHFDYPLPSEREEESSKKNNSRKVKKESWGELGVTLIKRWKHPTILENSYPSPSLPSYKSTT